MGKILVTGGSGFVGSHIILQLLAAGHQVRTTVRNLSRETVVRDMLQAGGAKSLENLSFFAADLEKDDGWADAVSGCDYVLHVASPLPVGVPKHEDDLIIPARDGTLRVLRAAHRAGVRRVVLTSSCAAVYYGHPPEKETFDESDWSNPNGSDVTPYVKSKLIAERAAWDFVAGEGKGLELSTINPVGIFGPILGPDYSASIVLLKKIMDGIPGCPRVYIGIVDVRDVADLHIRAMTNPAAAGQRFIAVAGPSPSMLEIARTLKVRMGAAARKAPTIELPDWVVRLAGKFSPLLRSIVPLLGKVRNPSNEKAKRVLEWNPRSNEDAIVATAESLQKFGLIK